MRIGALSRYIPSHRSTAPTKSRTGARNSVWPPSGLYLTRPRLVRTADTLGTGNMVTAGCPESNRAKRQYRHSRPS